MNFYSGIFSGHLAFIIEINISLSVYAIMKKDNLLYKYQH